MRQLIVRGEPGSDWAYFLNPKVACTSILSALPEDKRRRVYGRGPEAERASAVGFRFTFVRHPLDRLVSWWLNKICNPRGASQRYRCKYRWKQGTPFEDALQRICRMARKGSLTEWHIAPQSSFLPLNRLSFIGKLESISIDWLTIRDHVHGLADLPVTNQSEGRKPWRHYFDCLPSGLKKDVIGIYRRDFKRLNYEA